jgi:hypothetical protein
MMRRIVGSVSSVVVVLSGLVAAGFGTANAQSVAIITSPANGATVSGQVTIATQESTTVSWINVNADGVWFASNSPTASRPYSVTWNSTKVANGGHTLSVDSFSSSNNLIGSTAITVAVANGAATSTPTRTPSKTPTRTPAGTLTPKPSNTPTPVRTPIPNATAIGGAYYVAPTGSDSAAGTATAPWRTIQHAAAKLLAGQTAVVLPGSYVERVSITSSGNASAPITLAAAAGADVKVLGFNLSGSYWVLDGFDISTQTNNTDGYGVYVFRGASHVTIRNNYIHELCHEGIYMDSTVSYISVISNRIWRAEMAGAQVDGLYDLIQGNEVWGTQQQPAALGGIYSACTTPNGADADGFRFFGQHHDFVRNYLHDIVYGTKENPNPHIDCFQTWGSGSMKVDNVTFERNWCRWPSSSAQNHASMLEGTSGPVGTLTYKNNVFADMEDGLIIGEGQPSGVAVMKILNNTFDHIKREAVQFNDTRTSADEVTNNIFFDVGGGGDSYMCLAGGNPIIQSNDFYMRGGTSVGSYCSNAPYLSVNPAFVNSGDATGAGANYHLQAGSPVKDNGVTLPQVTNDYDGTIRPIGPGYSIGAFEE